MCYKAGVVRHVFQTLDTNYTSISHKTKFLPKPVSWLGFSCVFYSAVIDTYFPSTLKIFVLGGKLSSVHSLPLRLDRILHFLILLDTLLLQLLKIISEWLLGSYVAVSHRAHSSVYRPHILSNYVTLPLLLKNMLDI